MLIHFRRSSRAGSNQPEPQAQAARWLLRTASAKLARTNAGFTLLEVIVALAVLSISLTLALRTLSDGFHHQQRAKMLAEATAIAQSLLTRIGSDLPLKTGTDSGVLTNGFAWDVRIAPYGDGGDREAWPVAAYTVSVRVSQQRNAAKPAVVLDSIRLGPKAVAR